MGGLYKLIPFTWIVMLIGTLGLTGAPLMSGYYSKDGIIEAAFVSQTEGNLYAFYLLVLSALLTSFYSWRLIFLTFNGKVIYQLKFSLKFMKAQRSCFFLYLYFRYLQFFQEFISLITLCMMIISIYGNHQFSYLKIIMWLSQSTMSQNG